MDIVTLLNGSTLVLIIMALLMVGFLLTVPSTRPLGNRLLAALIFVTALTISVFFYGYFIQIPYALDKLRDDIGILVGPLLYLYVLASIYQDFRLRPVHLWHLAPLLVTLLLFLPNFYLVSSAEQNTFLSDYYTHWEARAAIVLGYLQAIFYILLTFWTLGKAKKVLLENYSDSRLLVYRWLYQLNSLNLLLFSFSLFKQVYRHTGPSADAFNLVRVIMVLLLLFFFLYIIRKALYYPQLFRGINSELRAVSALVTEQAAPVAAELDAEDQQKIDQLRAFMESEKPYLDSSLTLQKLARHCGMAANELSILINHKAGQHFFDFVNEYRIREAQAQLRDPDQKQRTILEILYAVGFNSKSSFNTAFKKYSGMTPSAYRKSRS
ncbi:MAG: AraC family transcriptional regulator [Bacteroidota bacterium]